jgi:transposase
MERALPGGDTMIEKTLIEFSQRAGGRPMTDKRTIDEIIAGIFDPPPSARERELAQRVTLLQNYVLNLQMLDLASTSRILER